MSEENQNFNEVDRQAPASEIGGGQVPDQKNRKSGKFIARIVAIALGAVLVVGIAAAVGLAVYRNVKKANMDPTEYYRYAMEKSRDENLKDMTAYYDMSKDMVYSSDGRQELDVQAEISDTAKSMISTVLGVDVTKVKNVGIRGVAGKEGDNALAGVTLQVNDKDILTGNASVNLKENKGYVQIPELSSSYLDVSKALASLQAQAGTALSALGDSRDMMPETRELEDFICRYSDIFLDNARDVEKKKEVTVEVEGISEKAVTYSYTMDNQKIIKLLKDYLKELQDDKLAQKVMSGLAGDQYDSAYSAYKQELQELEEDVESYLSEDSLGSVKAAVEAQISSDDRIVGQKVILENQGKELGSLSISRPQDGDKFGQEVVLQAQGKELFQSSGSGTDDSGVINAEFKMGVDSSLLEGSNLVNAGELLTVKYEDYDYSKLDQGKLKGSVILSTNAVAALANYSLALEQDSDKGAWKLKIKVLTGKDTLAAIDVSKKGGAKLPKVSPGAGDKCYDITDNSAMLQYQNEMNVMSVLGALQEETGIDLNSLRGSSKLGDEGYTDPGDAMTEDDGYYSNGDFSEDWN